MTMCDNNDLLVGYLYDDVTPQQRAAFETHLRSCAGCRDEVAALRSTREHLGAWAPPERDLGFQIVRHTVEPRGVVVPFRRRWMPAFGLAAAAVLVLAAASAIANLEVRYGNDGLIVRTGWSSTAPVPAPRAAQSPAAQPVDVASSAVTADFAAVEQRLRALEATMAAQPAGDAARNSDTELLRQVRAMVRDAESRQQGFVAQRLLQVMQDVERQRRTDFAILQQGSAQYQGITNARLAEINQALRVNQLEK
jgi:hypothetical protein